MAVIWTEEVAKIKNVLANLGYDYTDEEVDTAWRNFSREERFAGFIDPDSSTIDDFLLWGGFREPEDWEQFDMEDHDYMY